MSSLIYPQHPNGDIQFRRSQNTPRNESRAKNPTERITKNKIHRTICVCENWTENSQKLEKPLNNPKNQKYHSKSRRVIRKAKYICEYTYILYWAPLVIVIVV
ncbi:MAG: hypothetical protein ACETWM_19525 [Candidatus Lokiarchaeia archaeon]